MLDPLQKLKADLLGAFLAPLDNIDKALSVVEATPTVATVTEQFAVIKGQELTLALEVPAILPTLEGDGIAAGVQKIRQGISAIRNAIHNHINPASSGSGASSASGTAASAAASSDSGTSAK